MVAFQGQCRQHQLPILNKLNLLTSGLHHGDLPDLRSRDGSVRLRRLTQAASRGNGHRLI